MKYSQFNAVIPYDEKFALYNSYNQKVIFIEEGLKDILNAAIFEGIDNLQEIHPTFYAYLIAEKYVIEEDIREVELVKEITKQVDENHTDFFLTINPSMNCNFKCWYCYETHVKKSKLDEPMIQKINTFIDTTIAKPEIRAFSLSFFGGEPLLYFKKDVTPIIKAYADACKTKGITPSIGFTTNGYLINDEFINFFKDNDLTCSLQITLDGYKEEHDLVRFVNANKGSYEQIMKNIRLLINNKFYVRLRINYTDKNLHDSYKIADDLADITQELKDNYLLIDYHRVWQNDKVDNLKVVLDRNANIMRDQGLEVLTNFSPNNVLSSCYADKRNSAVINYNGDLFKCTARDFTNVKRAGYLSEEGELIWENDYLNKRMNAKFKNKPCLTCKIMPICNGGCSQHAMEHLEGDDYCVYHGDENEKDKVIATKVEELMNAAVAV
ncbi:Radical SAM protein [Pedobacter cryoconitis]|uniref:Radical SAM protein n=1 Tax=Pedobacter cryoconitis TaxID=188932 RepID=A0A127V824_9SPHI|nr:radical SAM protein [Pedobacter cryoconitis]AMP97395.1 Radical SAM protein [Pedobacter cryoconitis]